MNIYFKLEKKPNPRTGTPVDTLVKYTDVPGDGRDGTTGVTQTEDWCTVDELDALFDTCARRWGNNWDLNKVMTAIQECEFE